MKTFRPGERFYSQERWEDRGRGGPHIWRTLGYRRTVWEPGRQVVEWDATEPYCFPSPSGPIVHGGMVSTVLDTAMGGACWTLLDNDEGFLTADLRVEFLAPARPGLLRADGRVVKRSRRVVFCSGDLYDAAERLVATARCTQIVLSADGKSERLPDGRGPGGGT